MRAVPAAHPVVAYLPPDAIEYFTALAPDFELCPQVGDSLGERLDNVLQRYLQRGFRHAVVMSSDSPTLPPAILQRAFEALAGGKEVVLGPAEDGGYYLIGMSRPHPHLLRAVRMSTGSVAADTLALAAEERLVVGLLPVWFDVDDQAGLARLRSGLHRSSPTIATHTRAFLKGLNELAKQ